MKLKYQTGLKLLVASVLGLLSLGSAVFAQFVESPEIKNSANTPAIESSLQLATVFDVLIILSAVMFLISMFGIGIGLLKMVTSGGDEKTAEAGSNMLVLSGWIFGAAALSYLIVNIVKYFIY